MLRSKKSQSSSSVITVDESDPQAKSPPFLEVKRLTSSNSKARVYGFSPSGSPTSDAEKEKRVHAEGCFELSVVEFEHDMQQAILASIKESYRPSKDEEERRLISSEKTEESTGWMCKVSRAVSKSVDGLKTDLKGLSQQLQEPCQKLLTMYLDSVDDIDFDIAALSEEEQELLNISRASHEVISKGIPSVNQAITSDERWLLEHNDTVSNRKEEPSMRLSYEENRDALFAKSYINQQRIAAESKKAESTSKRCVIS